MFMFVIAFTVWSFMWLDVSTRKLIFFLVNLWDQFLILSIKLLNTPKIVSENLKLTTEKILCSEELKLHIDVITYDLKFYYSFVVLRQIQLSSLILIIFWKFLSLFSSLIYVYLKVSYFYIMIFRYFYIVKICFKNFSHNLIIFVCIWSTPDCEFSSPIIFISAWLVPSCNLLLQLFFPKCG